MSTLDSINQLIHLYTGKRRTGNQSFRQIRQINELEKAGKSLSISESFFELEV